MRTVGIVLRRMIMNAIIAWLLWKCFAGLTVVFILVLGVDIIANTVAPSNNATRHAVQMIRVCEVGLIRVMASIASETYLTMSRSIVEPPPPAR
jgi:cytosine/uracil/thiamine/allantoin permease